MIYAPMNETVMRISPFTGCCISVAGHVNRKVMAQGAVAISIGATYDTRKLDLLA